jgi:hypothetical protein
MSPAIQIMKIHQFKMSAGCPGKSGANRHPSRCPLVWRQRATPLLALAVRIPRSCSGAVASKSNL